jgi:hypothetical protein
VITETTRRTRATQSMKRLSQCFFTHAAKSRMSVTPAHITYKSNATSPPVIHFGLANSRCPFAPNTLRMFRARHSLLEAHRTRLGPLTEKGRRANCRYNTLLIEMPNFVASTCEISLCLASPPLNTRILARTNLFLSISVRPAYPAFEK